MDPLTVATTDDTQAVSSVYVPSLQLTQGQPPPIPANGGLFLHVVRSQWRCGNCCGN